MSKRSFTKWINGNVDEKRSFRADNEGKFLYDLYIGWQLLRQNDRKLVKISGKHVSKTCLGALRCVNSDCKLSEPHIAMRPRCSVKATEAFAKKGCKLCKQPLTHVQCNVRISFIFTGGEEQLDIVMRHRGEHTHGIYEEKHLSVEEFEALESVVMSDPAETPKGLVVGTSSIRPTARDPVRKISEHLQHVGRVKYYKATILKKNNAMYVKDNGNVLEEFRKLDDEYPRYLQSPMDIHPSSFCIPFCSPVVKDNLDFTKHPALTDVTYNCFTNGYYLCTTTMYLEEMDRYVVIFQAILGGLTAQHYARYFLALIKCYNIKFDDDFFGLVVDFSDAQRKGFCEAYKELVRDGDAEKYLKGCYYHFQQSVQRLASNHAIVPIGYDKQFREYATTMSTTSSKHIFDGAVAAIQESFPNAKRWIAWWTNPKIATMIFPSQSMMKEELLNHPTRTTNGVESFHRDLYRIVAKNKSLIPTIRQIFAYLQSQDANITACLKGVSINYPTKPRYNSGFVDNYEGLGLIIPFRVQKRKAKYENDGRAPDTTATLIIPKRGCMKKVSSVTGNIKTLALRI